MSMPRSATTFPTTFVQPTRCIAFTSLTTCISLRGPRRTAPRENRWSRSIENADPLESVFFTIAPRSSCRFQDTREVRRQSSIDVTLCRNGGQNSLFTHNSYSERWHISVIGHRGQYRRNSRDIEDKITETNFLALGPADKERRGKWNVDTHD
jgi:hypothetical protein